MNVSEKSRENVKCKVLLNNNKKRDSFDSKILF